MRAGTFLGTFLPACSTSHNCSICGCGGRRLGSNRRQHMAARAPGRFASPGSSTPKLLAEKIAARLSVLKTVFESRPCFCVQ